MAKNKITFIAGPGTFKRLSSFKTTEQVKEAVVLHKKANKLTKTERSVLDHLEGLSKNEYKGLSFKTKNNIAKYLGISRRTVIRVCNKLEQLGIIKQYEMKRKSDMRQTSCAVVILPATKKEDVTQEKGKVSHQYSNTFIKLNNNNKVIRKGGTDLHKQVNKQVKTTKETPIPSFIPYDFVKVVKPFFADTKTIFELYGKIRLAHAHSGINAPINELMDHVVVAVKDSIAAYKLNRIRKGSSLHALKGYLYATASYIFADYKRQSTGNIELSWIE